MVPPAPTAQTLLAPVPHRPRRYWMLPLVCGIQLVPFHFTMVPPAPAAQTLLASLPQTADRFCVVPLVCAVHVLPFHFRMTRRETAARVDGALIHVVRAPAAGSICCGCGAPRVRKRGL